ncbi:ABC transporter ATP-binding protein [Thermococcus sp. M36]|nr:ABC transporter ATP-binding protein [Thermococcus sp. M36]NJE06056.1 ABC transporter ATP-binding protein [Thermococcus sp. M36]
MEAVTVKDLTKSFGPVKALDSVTFSVEEGEIVGIIGPNGAGKTTLVRILSGLLKPDGGEVKVYGHELASEAFEVRKLFALLPQEARAHFYTLTPRDYIYHYLRMRGLPRKEARLRAEKAVEEFGIEYADRIMSGLSGGMVRKTLLAMILSADAKVYYLDEPTVGLDVENRLKLWEILRDKAREASILMTSHYLNEISTVCDRVLLLKRGRVIAFDTPERIGKRYLSAFHSKIVVFGDFAGEGHTVRKAGRNTVVYLKSAAEEREVMGELEEAGLPFKKEELTIEDVFLVGELG